jgi:hypothetical protein
MVMVSDVVVVDIDRVLVLLLLLLFVVVVVVVVVVADRVWCCCCCLSVRVCCLPRLKLPLVSSSGKMA